MNSRKGPAPSSYFPGMPLPWIPKLAGWLEPLENTPALPESTSCLMRNLLSPFLHVEVPQVPSSPPNTTQGFWILQQNHGFLPVVWRQWRCLSFSCENKAWFIYHPCVWTPGCPCLQSRHACGSTSCEPDPHRTPGSLLHLCFCKWCVCLNKKKIDLANGRIKRLSIKVHPFFFSCQFAIQSSSNFCHGRIQM